MNKVNTPQRPNHVEVTNEHYTALDGMRAFAAIGIVMMHVQANLTIKPTSNYLTDTIIPFFTDFVYLFMMISAFGLSCGYYERIKLNQITPNAFYQKRIKRILPFFAIMVLIDVLWERNLSSLLEGFADITLCFGLYPNADIRVIGVGWFIGLVFVFYMVYPFFVFLIDNKRRAWATLIASLVLTLIGIHYFSSSSFFDHPMNFGRKNIMYCAPFFVVGGIVYLYREGLAKWECKHQWLMLLIAVAITILAFVSFDYVPKYIPTLILFAAWLVYGLGSKDVILNNKVALYIGKISMEIYLCHMLFFRVVGIAHLERHIQNSNLLYIITLLGTLIGAIIFSHVCKFYVIGRIKWLK